MSLALTLSHWLVTTKCIASDVSVKMFSTVVNKSLTQMIIKNKETLTEEAFRKWYKLPRCWCTDSTMFLRKQILSSLCHPELASSWAGYLVAVGKLLGAQDCRLPHPNPLGEKAWLPTPVPKAFWWKLDHMHIPETITGKYDYFQISTFRWIKPIFERSQFPKSHYKRSRIG